MESVGAYEAKTHLPQLLDRVVRGVEFFASAREADRSIKKTGKKSQ